MKSRTVVLASGLILVCSIGAQVLSDESDDKLELTKEVQRLRAEVSTLRRQVDYLMIGVRFEENDIDALTQRVRHAKIVQSRVQALFQTGGQRGTAEQLHRCNAELRLAQARLAFAKKEYDAAMKHLDAAVAASKMVQQVLQNKLDAGTVTLDFLIASQQSVTDAQLEKNRMRRKIQFLTAAKRIDLTDGTAWQPTGGWGSAERRYARNVEIKMLDGHPRFAVNEPSSLHTWYWSGLQIDIRQHPIAYIRYRAKNIATDWYSIWLDDGTGPTGGCAILELDDLLDDGEVHEHRVDLRKVREGEKKLDPQRTIVGAAIGVASSDDAPGLFELLEFRVEADQER